MDFMITERAQKQMKIHFKDQSIRIQPKIKA